MLGFKVCEELKVEYKVPLQRLSDYIRNNKQIIEIKLCIY